MRVAASSTMFATVSKRFERSVDARTGYAHPSYAASMAGHGRPIHLPDCGGWLLARDIPGTPHRDLCGPYPLMQCQDWSAWPGELRRLEFEYVSLVFVVDPFSLSDPSALADLFNASVVPSADTPAALPS